MGHSSLPNKATSTVLVETLCGFAHVNTVSLLIMFTAERPHCITAAEVNLGETAAFSCGRQGFTVVKLHIKSAF